MNQQEPYDILTNIITATCGKLGLAYTLLSGNSGASYLLFGLSSAIALISTILYLYEMPRLQSLNPSDDKYHSVRGFCLITNKMSVFAVASQSGIIAVLSYA